MNIGDRIWELDFLRGIAVCMMLVSNFVFDLYFFSNTNIFQPGGWAWLAKATAGLFLLVSGLSLSISNQQIKGRKKGFRGNLKRGAMIFGLGLLISLATRLAVGDDFVIFGILHLIGLGIILAYPFLKFPPLVSLVVGVAVLSANYFTHEIILDVPWFIWLGLGYHGFASVDYTPIIPWFGLMLIGLFLGQIIYPARQRRFYLPALADLQAIRLIGGLGRNSLIIYFVHQPVLWGGFYLVGTFS